MRVHLHYSASRHIWNACFLLPALALFLAVIIIPLFQGIPYAFTNWNGISPTNKFIGLRNFVRLFHDEEMWKALSNTFVYTLFYIVFSNILGLAVALLLQRSSKVNNLCRTLIFMPYVVSMLTAAFVWKSIFNDVYVPLFNMPSPLGVPKQALLGVVAISVWRTSGYCMLIYLAALQSVPEEYYEAAMVEGANGPQKFFKITLPLIVPAMTSNISLLMAWGFKAFDTVIAATGGGPGNATETMAMFVYYNIFGYSKAGYGQAAAIIMTVLLLTLTVLVSHYFRSKEVEA